MTHVTNGVHVPSWDSRWADHVWTEACGKARWRGAMEPLPDAIRCVTDEALWAFRAQERRDLVRYARERLAQQLGQRGAAPNEVARAAQILDPEALTLGFARRFAGYKRPNLLLHDPDRLGRLLTSLDRPVQIIVAGKAHPRDAEGKRLLQGWAEFVRRPAVRSRAVFLEDYDMSLAQELVQGVDVWINTPRRPWEACGTSGMKVLVNGGLNLSELDGWWAEAYRADAGWALGGDDGPASGSDADDAERLYGLLEQEIIPEFYARDAQGIPRAWVERIRASMANLAPSFSSNRMMREYVERHYLPAASAFQRRSADGARLARELGAWTETLERHWSEVRFGDVNVSRERDGWRFEAQVYLGAVPADMVRRGALRRCHGRAGTGAAAIEAMRRGSSAAERLRVPGYRTGVLAPLVALHAANRCPSPRRVCSHRGAVHRLGRRAGRETLVRPQVSHGHLDHRLAGRR